MNIQSISSSLGAYTTSGAQPAPAQQNPQAQQTRQAPQTAPTEQREPKPEERVELREETPKPVVNGQGQTTGTLINVTA